MSSFLSFDKHINHSTYPDRCSGEVAKISKHSLGTCMCNTIRKTAIHLKKKKTKAISGLLEFTCDREKYSAKRYPTILSSFIEKLYNIVWRKSNKYSRIPVDNVI